MIVHPKFVFAHLEKTGGMFVDSILIKLPKTFELGSLYKANKLSQDVTCYNLRNEPPCRHEALYRYLSYFADRKLYGFVRNPFDWYVSFWSFSQTNYHTRHDPDNSVYKYICDSKADHDLNIFIDELINERTILDYYKDKLGVNSNPKPELAHIDLGICQDLDIGLLTYRYLYTFYAPSVFEDLKHYKDYKIVDEVFRFENLREELVNVLSRYDITIKDIMSAPKVNCSPHDMYELYYNDKTIDTIYHRDRIIFEEFDYSY